MKSNFTPFLKKKGLTLIEMIIAMAVFSVIFLLLGNLFQLSLKTLNHTRNSYSEKHEIYTALSYIEHDIRKSHIIIDTYKENTFNNKNKSIGFMTIRFNKDENSSSRKKYTYVYYSLINEKGSGNLKKLCRNSSSTDYLSENQKFPLGKRAINVMAGNIKNLECNVNECGINLRIEMDNSHMYERFIARRCFLWLKKMDMPI